MFDPPSEKYLCCDLPAEANRLKLARDHNIFSQQSGVFTRLLLFSVFVGEAIADKEKTKKKQRWYLACQYFCFIRSLCALLKRLCVCVTMCFVNGNVFSVQGHS